MTRIGRGEGGLGEADGGWARDRTPFERRRPHLWIEEGHLVLTLEKNNPDGEKVFRVMLPELWDSKLVGQPGSKRARL